jgi:diacylglycerol kinase family enzyme
VAAERGLARAVAECERDAAIMARLDTAGDGGDRERIAALIEGTTPDVVVAAGGDGTVNEALNAIRQARVEHRPALAILALGTGNNAARSLGLESFRRDVDVAVDLAAAAILRGSRRRIDAGEANGRLFLGSFALGMDADILALRNRLSRRVSLPGQWGGYALYLAACALSFGVKHGGEARLALDEAAAEMRLFNVAVLNLPLYAGEFRFDADNDADDGQLDVHAVASASEYLREYPIAWRRHLRHARGEAVQPSSRLRRAAEITIELDRAVPAQVDGEELAPARRFHVRAVPAAVELCIPPSARDRSRDRRER